MLARVEKGYLQRLVDWDAQLLRAVAARQVPAVTRLMRALTRAGDTSTWAAVSLALLLSGGSAVGQGASVAAASLIATALVQPLKRLCRRARPSRSLAGFTALVENPDAFSFPSGHTAAAVAVAIALAGSSGHLGAAAFALALGIGASRVYLGAHYPLDVAAGGGLGVLAGTLARVVEVTWLTSLH